MPKRIDPSQRRRIVGVGLALPLLASGLKAAEMNNSSDEPGSLQDLLARIKRIAPAKVLASLLPGATDAELAELRRTVLKGQPIPDDIAVLLRWHNGQQWNAPLSPEDNRRLLSTSEIIEQWSFFQDPTSDFMEPWRDSWVPLLTNDSSDFVVYETQGAARGQLIAYWHDDERRPVNHASLRAWAKALLSELENA